MNGAALYGQLPHGMEQHRVMGDYFGRDAGRFCSYSQ